MNLEITLLNWWEENHILGSCTPFLSSDTQDVGYFMEKKVLY